METITAVAALSALSHESRLSAFRLLVRAGEEGVPAGEIASELGVAPPTLSFHLGQLVQAGLVVSHRESRSVLYSLKVDGIRELIGYLTEDCCQGRPELCSTDGAKGADGGGCC
jgi:DNA-binding transcriptional ArsR family regulator